MSWWRIVVRVPDGIEDFACGVVVCLRMSSKLSLKLCWAGIFHPEEVVRLEVLTETGGFNRSKAMVDVVKEMNVGAEFDAEFFEELRGEVEVALGGPEGFGGRPRSAEFVGLTDFWGLRSWRRRRGRRPGRGRRGSPRPCACGRSRGLRRCRLRWRGCLNEAALAGLAAEEVGAGC